MHFKGCKIAAILARKAMKVPKYSNYDVPYYQSKAVVKLKNIRRKMSLGNQFQNLE
jgi:hypothetical protein